MIKVEGHLLRDECYRVKDIKNIDIKNNVIYFIINENSFKYIGTTDDIKKRLNDHNTKKRKKKCTNNHMKNLNQKDEIYIIFLEFKSNTDDYILNDLFGRIEKILISNLFPCCNIQNKGGTKFSIKFEKQNYKSGEPCIIYTNEDNEEKLVLYINT